MYIYFEIAEETTKKIYFTHDQNNDADMGSLEYSTNEYTYLSEISDLWTKIDIHNSDISCSHHLDLINSWDVYKTTDLENKIATINKSDGTILANDNYVLVPSSFVTRTISYIVNDEIIKTLPIGEFTGHPNLNLGVEIIIDGYYLDENYNSLCNDPTLILDWFYDNIKTNLNIYVKISNRPYIVSYVFLNTNQVIFSERVTTKNYVLKSSEIFDKVFTEFDGYYASYFFRSHSGELDEEYYAGDEVELFTDIIENGEFANTVLVTFKTYFKGIKYYYNNELVYTQNATSWDIEFWNLETIDKTDLCSFENLILVPKLKEINISQLTSIDELRIGYENYYRDILKQDCNENYFAEVVVTTEHDDFYYGPTIIYKNISSYLLPEDIENLISQNIVNCKHSIIYEFEDVDYIGNASTSGSYQYKLKMNDKEYIIQIVVTKNINSSYIYGKDLYFPVNSKLSTNQIVSDLKKVGLIENTNLSTRFIAKNESSSKYLTEQIINPGIYNYTINYQSTNGINGEIDVNLNVLNAMDFTTDDPIDTSCKKLNLKTEDIIAYCLVGLFVVGIFFLLFSGKRKRR